MKEEEKVLVVRLTKEMYNALEKQLATQLKVSSNTTPIEVGHALGVQLVLKLLRDGFVIGE